MSFLAEKLNTPKAVIVVLVLFAIVDGFLLYKYHGSMSTISLADEQTPGEIGSAVVQAKNPRAIFLGDSFTEGAGGSRYGGYVTSAEGGGLGRSAIRGRRNGNSCRLWRGGRQEEVPRPPLHKLSTKVFPSAPKVVVIAGGLNDAPLIENGSSTLDEYRDEYDALIADIKRGLPEAKIVVLGPFSPGSPTSRPGLKDIRDANRAAAQAAGVPFIDAFYIDEEDKSSYISADGAHPNDAWYEYLGEKVGADLVEALS